jgi:hypothetical protein
MAAMWFSCFFSPGPPVLQVSDVVLRIWQALSITMSTIQFSATVLDKPDVFLSRDWACEMQESDEKDLDEGSLVSETPRG